MDEAGTFWKFSRTDSQGLEFADCIYYPAGHAPTLEQVAIDISSRLLNHEASLTPPAVDGE